MDLDGDQQLFLMEFLVDKVNIPVVRAIHEEMLPVTNCVSFQILGLPPVDIHQEALTEGCACTENDGQLFKKGKSCLFALPTMILRNPLPTFPVNMSVYKKLPPGVLPDVMLIGSTQIEARDLINGSLTEFLLRSGNSSKALKDIFTITTATGQCVGEVTAFIRVSCFGRKIVTQFQLPHNRKPYLFKGADDSPIFQCKKVPSSVLDSQVRCTCPVGKSAGDGGEATRTCCPTRVSEQKGTAALSGKYKRADRGPRPCCPSKRK